MSNHTPGPWYALSEGITDSAIGYRAIVDSDGVTVCNPSPMGEANARLIAAAPDLLAALQGLMNYVGGWDESTDHPCGIARAAIEKATRN